MQQITFSFESTEKITTDFIVSSSNKLAHNAILNWPSNWGTRPYDKTLIICGPKSSGKTTLANIWSKQNNALFIRKNHELTTSIVNYHDSFVIDGFDDSWQENDVLHYFNILHENKKFLLITTTNIAAIQLPDLASRLNSSNRINIEQPDDELVKTLIFKLFSNYSVAISNEVINYLIKFLPRDFVAIINIVAAINHNALCNKRKITIPLVKEHI